MHRPTKPSNQRAPHLRLRRDETAAPEGEPVPETYKFPVRATSKGGGGSRTSRRNGSGGGARVPRERLVAARVDRTPVEKRFTGSDSPCAVLSPRDQRESGRAGRIVSSRELVREIETTLDRMQARLSSFRDQMEDVFRFPAPDENDDFDPPPPFPPYRPRAA